MDEEKRVTVRIPADLHARLVAEAKRDRRSLNSEIVYLLESALPDADPPGGESAQPAPPRGKPDSSPA